MANWCDGTIEITGDVAQLTKLETEINANVKNHGDGEEPILLWEQIVKEGVEDRHNWVEMVERPKIENGTLSFHYSRKWLPPYKSFVELSREYPGLLFTITYSIEGWWDAGEIEIKDGQTEQTKHHRGYFDMVVKEDQPVHHYLVSASPAVREGIQKAGLAVLGEEDEGQLTIRDNKAVETLLERDFPTEDVSLTAYTLDEDCYLGSVQTAIEQHWAWAYPTSYRDRLLWVAERDIALTQDEVLALATMRWQDFQWYWKSEGIREEVPAIVFFSPLRVERIAAYFRDWSYPSNPVFHPTGQEIRLLLASGTPSEDRAAALKDALWKPRWTKEWPKWEITNEVQERKEKEEKEYQEKAIAKYKAALHLFRSVILKQNLGTPLEVPASNEKLVCERQKNDVVQVRLLHGSGPQMEIAVDEEIAFRLWNTNHQAFKENVDKIGEAVLAWLKAKGLVVEAAPNDPLAGDDDFMRELEAMQ